MFAIFHAAARRNKLFIIHPLNSPLFEREGPGGEFLSQRRDDAAFIINLSFIEIFSPVNRDINLYYLINRELNDFVFTKNLSKPQIQKPENIFSLRRCVVARDSIRCAAARKRCQDCLF
jgi:hypothetical protein